MFAPINQDNDLLGLTNAPRQIDTPTNIAPAACLTAEMSFSPPNLATSIEPQEDVGTALGGSAGNSCSPRVMPINTSNHGAGSYVDTDIFLSPECGTEDWQFYTPVFAWPLTPPLQPINSEAAPPLPGDPFHLNPKPLEDIHLKSRQTTGNSIHSAATMFASYQLSERLGDLHMDIYRILVDAARELSGSPHLASPGAHYRWGNSDCAPQTIPIEDLIKLTDKFVSIMEEMKDIGGPVSLSSLSFPWCLDLATWLQVLSIYTRFLEAYEVIFGTLNSMLCNIALDDILKTWKLPDISISSMQIEFSPSLHTALTVRLGKQCLESLSTALSRLFETEEIKNASISSSKNSVDPGLAMVHDLLSVIRKKEGHISGKLAESVEQISSLPTP